MRTWLTIAAAGILAVASEGAQAGEITVLSGMGSYSGIRDLAASFQKLTGHKVNAVFETQLNQKLNANAPADVVAAGPDQMDDLVKIGKVVPGTDTPFRVGVLKISTQPILARAFITFAVSREAGAILRQSHLEPVKL